MKRGEEPLYDEEMLQRLSVVLCVALGSACTGQAPTDPSPLGVAPSTGSVAPLSPALSFAASRALLERGIVSQQFNFGTLRDLWTRVTLPGMAQYTTVKLKFYSPRGWLFRSTYAVFSPDPNAAPMDAPGVEHPVDVAAARPLPGGFALDFAVPIAGSPFTKFPEEGTWQVRAEVAGQAEELAVPLTIEMHR